MISIFSQYFLIIPYISWSIAYFYTSLMKPKKWLKRPMLSVFLIAAVVNMINAIIKMHSVTTGTNLLQTCIFLISFFCFDEKLSRKFSCFLIYDITGIAAEAISTNSFLIIRNLLYDSAYSYPDVSQISSMNDVLLMSGLNIAVGVIFFVKETPLMKRCFSLLNAKIFLQLILTLLIPTFAQGLIIYQTENPQFPLLSGIYWILCLVCYPIFLLGLRNIRKQEKRSLMKQNQLMFMKEQLAFSQTLEQEYKELRKWNHDSENHLLALAYLMDMERYEEAGNYFENT